MDDIITWVSDYLGPIVVVTPFVIFILMMIIGTTVEIWEEGFYFFRKMARKQTINETGVENARQFPEGRFDKRLAYSSSQSIHNHSAA